ncbi:lysine-2,3-aminomutase-like protein [Cereibacter sp. SYSU M97828]|nr:lysine-2,3-aminomutase-like protein [Cereibacter flavus]
MKRRSFCDLARLHSHRKGRISPLSPKEGSALAPRKPAITKVADLIREGLADPTEAEVLDQVAENFRIRITPEMQGQSEGLARQFVPSAEELTIRPEELTDPIGDAAHSPVPGLTHRYPDRVILHATQTCEVYCRFCFRREAVGSDGALGEDELDAAIDYIARTPAIWEVILTGGDPMVLSARRLSALLNRIAAIDHVAVVRFHTRVPVVSPERVNDALIAALRIRPAVYVVVHTNHPDELTPEARGAFGRLADAGVPLLSQTVLLRGVNADAETLERLFRLLVSHRVKPYYLHHCDLARGTGHFRTTIAEGEAIMSALRGRVSGVCLPTYVLDLPGGFGKVPLGARYVEGSGPFRITDYLGRTHLYSD